MGDDIHIGLRMLWHGKRRLALSGAGITFAVVIMFLQVGFFNGINDSQARFARIVNADLVMLDVKRTNLNKWDRFPSIHLAEAAAMPEVAEVVPIYQDGVGLKNPQTDQVKRIIVYAFPPTSRPFTLPPEQMKAFDALKVEGNALFDRRSRQIYGDLKIGDTLYLDAKPYRLAGFVDLGPNLINDGGVLLGHGSWQGDSVDPVIGLVRLKPGVDRARAAAAMRAHLSSELVVMTPEELSHREVVYTIVNAPVGAIFGIGLIVSLFIGIVICYQILFNEITDNIPQYATLKAMGFERRYLIGIILEEAAALSVIGFVPGLAIAIGLYAAVGNATRLIMDMTVGRAALIFVLALTMCLSAGLIAMRKVLNVDPADLY
jgi:putative ABC transport system permease protein